MSTTAFPSRRKVAGPPPIPDTIRELAVTVYTQNKIMNAAKGIHDKKRVELLGAMDANGITDFTHAATINDVPVVLNVEIKTPNASFVDGEAAMALLFPSVAKAVKGRAHV